MTVLDPELDCIHSSIYLINPYELYRVYDTTRCWKEMERNTDMLPITRTLHMKSRDGKTNKYQKNVK